MSNYISCITRMLLNSHRIFMSSCSGEPSLYDTHCQFCHYWADNDGDHDDPAEDDEDILGENEEAQFSRENDIHEDDNEEDDE